jgi:hypothetical protein
MALSGGCAPSISGYSRAFQQTLAKSGGVGTRNAMSRDTKEISTITRAVSRDRITTHHSSRCLNLSQPPPCQDDTPGVPSAEATIPSLVLVIVPPVITMTIRTSLWLPALPLRTLAHPNPTHKSLMPILRLQIQTCLLERLTFILSRPSRQSSRGISTNISAQFRTHKL